MKKANLIILGSIVASMMLVACNGASSKTYAKTLSIAIENPVAAEGFDGKVEPNKTLKLTYTYSPEKIDDKNISWNISDTKLASVSNAGFEDYATFNAKDEGEVTVYATLPGAGNTVIKSNELKIKIEGNYKVNADFSKAKTTFGSELKQEDLNVNTLYKNQGSPHQDPLAENHILVVPFGFEDEKLTPRQNDDTINHIKKTFFGTHEEMDQLGAWESLQSFYNKSSYGKGGFIGDVCDSWCVYNGTAASFLKANGGNLGVAASEYARKWYTTEYAKTNHGSLGADAKPITWYDNNGDGYIDLVWIVYSQPTGDTSNWWAYVTYTSNAPNKTSPTVKTLGFASIDWMYKSLGGYDPHTYIHETGHTFGLPDYYDYNNTWSPMGGVDFMDHNIGDHSMYSKFTLGWTSPLVVDDDAIITLRPGTTTGDCFIIPSPGYNGTAFDEYMMVELMAPVGLAEKDYLGTYEGTEGYSKPGLRITHCDSRVYNLKNGNTRDSYLVNNPQEGIDYRIDNSYGGRGGLKVDGDYFPIEREDGKVEKSYMTLYSLMESVIDPDKNWTTTSTYNATNAALFTPGQSFTLSSKRSWAKTFMPSKTNLWNKAKTITGWNKDEQTYTIDKTCTFNYVIKCLSIEKDSTDGYVARVQVTKNAY